MIKIIQTRPWNEYLLWEGLYLIDEYSRLFIEMNFNCEIDNKYLFEVLQFLDRKAQELRERYR